MWSFDPEASRRRPQQQPQDASFSPNLRRATKRNAASMVSHGAKRLPQVSSPHAQNLLAELESIQIRLGELDSEGERIGQTVKNSVDGLLLLCRERRANVKQLQVLKESIEEKKKNIEKGKLNMSKIESEIAGEKKKKAELEKQKIDEINAGLSKFLEKIEELGDAYIQAYGIHL